MASVRRGGAGNSLLLCGWAVSFRVNFTLVPGLSIYLTIRSFWILITCASALRSSCTTLGLRPRLLRINKVNKIISVQLMQILNSSLLSLTLFLLSSRARPTTWSLGLDSLQWLFSAFPFLLPFTRCLPFLNTISELLLLFTLLKECLLLGVEGLGFFLN